MLGGKNKMWILGAFLIGSIGMGQSLIESSEHPRTCEPITIDMCKGLGYKMTSMPNFVGHYLQTDAFLQLQTYNSLVQCGCSSQLQVFLCSVYVPMCTEKVPNPIGPCRSLCEIVRDRCSPVLKQFGFPWPVALNCSKFPPENNHVHMCMEGPGEKDPTGPPVHHFLDFRNSLDLNRPSPFELPLPHGPSAGLSLQGLCTDYKKPEGWVFINRTKRCAQVCDADVAFTADEKDFAGVWMAVWASLCLASTLFTIITFLLEPGNFRYPERPIVLLYGCYALMATGMLVRVIVGRRGLACQRYGHDTDILVQDGLGNTACALVFLLIYYFGTGASVWWVILTFTWFLSCRRWTADRIAGKASFYHLVAWGVPAAFTIAILVMHEIDADELTGLCSVGNQDDRALVQFVIGPQLTCLVLGSIFLAVGFLTYPRDRNGARRPLAIRIGIFSLLYIVPAACVMAGHFYQLGNRSAWVHQGKKPFIELFMLEIFMSMVVGITSGMWVWSEKTGKSWRGFCHRLVPIPTPGVPLEKKSTGSTPLQHQHSNPVTSPLVRDSSNPHRHHRHHHHHHHKPYCKSECTV
ncbi:unnamed protein product [Darwinula stevensoni]|uniref:Frizzled-4 n=1 Tax=Darwinula stevensoni TaxID=69355 RepID=A0A7R9A1F4_9CRUS|nr:unnamed protein product [Darwinula stevensoni]CAG0887632.1 unnamed protein product [Darwinula stevensoni]